MPCAVFAPTHPLGGDFITGRTASGSQQPYAVKQTISFLYHRSRFNQSRLPETQYIQGLNMPAIRVKENEPFEVAMRRFKRSVEKTGLLTELRAREAYEKPTTERKRKKAAAVKRLQKRLRSQQLPPKYY